MDSEGQREDVEVPRQRGAARTAAPSARSGSRAVLLLREIPFGQDGNFSYEALITRLNADLANGIGNLASRTLTMIRNYRQGRVPTAAAVEGLPQEVEKAVAAYRESFERYEFHRALEGLWTLIGFMDRAIVQYQPWTLAKKEDAESQSKLDAILYSAPRC